MGVKIFQMKTAPETLSSQASHKSGKITLYIKKYNGGLPYREKDLGITQFLFPPPSQTFPGYSPPSS